jgi:TPP-dependent trihydroxycyclohexane-1,2-dione (THcHDO) dehydratase
MRKLITTVAAVLALAGVGLAAHHATSDAPADAAIVFDVGTRFTGPSSGFYWMS